MIDVTVNEDSPMGTTVNSVTYPGPGVLIPVSVEGEDSSSSSAAEVDIPLPVSQGGTGATTLTDGGLLLGSGTNPITALAQATNGQLPIGSTGGDPVLGEITAVPGQTIITNAAGSIRIGLDTNINLTVDDRFRYMFMMSGH